MASLHFYPLWTFKSKPLVLIVLWNYKNNHYLSTTLEYISNNTPVNSNIISSLFCKEMRKKKRREKEIKTSQNLKVIHTVKVWEERIQKKKCRKPNPNLQFKFAQRCPSNLQAVMSRGIDCNHQYSVCFAVLAMNMNSALGIW